MPLKAKPQWDVSPCCIRSSGVFGFFTFYLFICLFWYFRVGTVGQNSQVTIGNYVYLGSLVHNFGERGVKGRIIWGQNVL